MEKINNILDALGEEKKCGSLEDIIIQKEEKIEVKEWEHVTEDEWERINWYHCEDGKSKKKRKKRRYNRDI